MIAFCMFQQFGRPVLSVNQLLLTTDRFLPRSRLNLWVVAKISYFVFTAIQKTNPETRMTLIAWFEKSLPLFQHHQNNWSMYKFTS